MEVQTLHDHKLGEMDYQSNVDTSRPFRSVKEAVAIFGEKFLVGEIYAPKNFSFSKQETPVYSPSNQCVPREASLKYSPMPSPDKSNRTSDGNDQILVDSLKKLEAELEETKMELKLLKERESETEVALASLNAELHRNMSKLAQAEADAAAAASRPKRYGEIEEADVKGEKRRDLIKKLETNSSTLAQILSIGEKGEIFGSRKREKRVMKKKPIIPLVGDLFSRKKGASTTLQNPLFSYSLN